MSSMNHLSGETVRLITSSQVITSVHSVVKELLENSLDANTDNIDVKLENFGFDKIEVRDNGDGITTENAIYMGQKHYTSKICNHGDLVSLATYGFRGEALGSLCAVSNVTIVTKTKEDTVSHLYVLDNHGKILSSKPSHLDNGTTVTVSKLFKNIPVRRQYYSNAKRRREELKKVEDLLMVYGAIRHDIRTSLSHNKKPVWQKNKTSSQRTALLNTWGGSVMKQMVQAQKTDAVSQVTIDAYVPKADADYQLISRAQSDRSWISINGRPVSFKEIEKIVKQYYCGTAKQDGNSVRHLVMYVAITMPTSLVDVNLEPNKTKVLLQNTDAILLLLTDILQDVYAPLPAKHTADSETKNSAINNNNNSSAIPTSQELSETCMREIEGTKYDRFEQSSELQDKNKPGASVAEKNTGLLSMEVPGKQSVSRLDIGITPAPEDTRANRETHFVRETPVRDEDENNFTSLKYGDLILQSQPQFDLMDLSVDLFDGSANVTQPLEGGENLTQLPKNPPCSSDDKRQRCLNVPMETTTKQYEPICMDSANGIGNMTDVNWSKGVGLVDLRGHAIEPSVLLVPGKCLPDRSNTLSDDTSACNIPANERLANTTSDNPNNISTNQNSGTEPFSQNLDGELTTTNQNFERQHLTNQNSEQELLTNHQRSSCGRTGNDKGSPGKYRRSLEGMTGQAMLYDLVGNAVVKKPREAFDFFSKQIRPTVVKENPGMDVGAVNSLIDNKWDELSDEERKEYEKLGQKDADRYQEQIKSANETNKVTKTGCMQMTSRKRKKLEKLANQNLIDEMLASQSCRATNKKKQKSPNAEAVVKEIAVNFDMQSLRGTLAQPSDTSVDDDSQWHLIGQISSNNLWLAWHQQQLLVINQYRIQESLLYSRLMATHILPVQHLDAPVVINSKMLGGDKNWVSLLSLQSMVTPPSPDRYFVDDRLKYNGFHIKQTTGIYVIYVIFRALKMMLTRVLKAQPFNMDICRERIHSAHVYLPRVLSTDSESSDVRIEVIAMTTSISYYGIDDLREILDMITAGSTKLAQCRPLKIANYLQGETMRMVRGLSADMSQDEMYDIIESMEMHLSPLGMKTCLHDKPYLCILQSMVTD